MVFSLSTVSCCSEDTCDDSSIAVEQAEHDEDSCTNCPPLLACGTCAGFVFQTASFSFQPIGTDNTANITPWKEGAILMWPLKIWQPPKLA